MPKLKALLIDLSGTIHIGNESTLNAGKAIERLRKGNIIVRFVSNTSKESRSSLLSKMIQMKLDVREDELFTSLSAVKDLVLEKQLNPLYLLTDSAISEFPLSSAPFDSVVVGLAPNALNYSNMNEAFRLLSGETTGRKDLNLIATHKALYYRSSDGLLSIGPGPFITALEESTGIKAEIVGKPTKSFFEFALKSLEKEGINREDWNSVGMIGDDVRQDVGFVPHSLGLKRYLVKTGKYREGDELSLGEGDKLDWCGNNFEDAVNVILSECN